MSDEMKLDRVLSKLDDITERLVKVETLIGERANDISAMYRRIEDLEKRVSELEKHKTQVISAKDIFTWAVMAAIALWGVLK